MRVLHLVGGLANSSGTTHIVLNLARVQAESGCDVAVYHVSGRTPDTVTATDDRVRVRGFPLTGPCRYAHSAHLRRALRTDLRRFDVAHVHSVWLHPNYLLWRAAVAAGTPYVVAPQGALDDWTLAHHPWRKRLYGALVERRILNAAACVQAVTRREAANVRALGVRAPIRVVPNGVHVAALATLPDREAARARLDIAADELVVLFLGRLHPKKGLPLLVRAFSDVVRREKRARLLVAGSDNASGYVEAIRREVEAMGVADRVRMLGEVKAETKRAVLAASDLFALTSHSEGLPVASLEAMAAGLPVVLSEGCYVPEAASWGAGRVVPRDRNAVATAITEILSDPGLRAGMARRARRLAGGRFDWTVVGRRLKGLYEAVVDGRRAIGSVPFVEDSSGGTPSACGAGMST